ncbi:MAG: transposase, partial [Gammaproteobacteria bacterium]|nr:transposase [Gammaproteobacteria bacterium]
MRRCGAVRCNLRRLYRVRQVPADTTMRERLDRVDPAELRGKGLDGFAWLDGHCLLSVDGTGHFPSKSVHCDSCCVKEHRDGTRTHCHRMLGAALVHPDFREVFALPPEPILRGDGATRNDCERNAAKRLLRDVRRE